MREMVDVPALTPQQRAALAADFAAAYRQGDTIAMIASQWFCTAVYVKKLLLEAGVQLRPPHSPHPAVFRGRMLRRAAALIRYAQGMSLHDVGYAVGVSHSQVRLWIHDLGITCEDFRRIRDGLPADDPDTQPHAQASQP